MTNSTFCNKVWAICCEFGERHIYFIGSCVRQYIILCTMLSSHACKQIHIWLVQIYPWGFFVVNQILGNVHAHWATDPLSYIWSRKYIWNGVKQSCVHKHVSIGALNIIYLVWVFAFACVNNASYVYVRIYNYTSGKYNNRILHYA